MGESTHWYDKEGNPAYTVTGKNGRERPTTLADAKKMGLVPSVTTIIGCSDKPGLTNWKIDQAILSALTLPRIDGEDEASYLARVKKDASETGRKAAERGTQIHAWIEQGFSGDMEPEGIKYFQSSLATIEKECGDMEWKVETPFSTERYGGKVDLHNDEYLIDIKTTEKELETIRTWDEHGIQLSAYDSGLGGRFRKCGILYVHAITTESRLIFIDEFELEKGFMCFKSLLSYCWYAKTGLNKEDKW